MTAIPPPSDVGVRQRAADHAYRNLRRAGAKARQFPPNTKHGPHRRPASTPAPEEVNMTTDHRTRILDGIRNQWPGIHEPPDFTEGKWALVQRRAHDTAQFWLSVHPTLHQARQFQGDDNTWTPQAFVHIATGNVYAPTAGDDGLAVGGYTTNLLYADLAA